MAKTKFIPPGTKVVAIPVIAFVVIVSLVAVVITQGLSRIKEQQKTIVSNKKTELILEEKEQELSTNSSNLDIYIPYANTALPDRNPALATILQIKTFAENNNVNLVDFKVSIGSGLQIDKLTSIGVSVKIEGDHNDVITFIRDTEKLAPIATLGGISLQVDEGFNKTSAEFNMSVYWAGFPENLPTITAPIDKLTQEDREVLEKLSDLIQPQFLKLDPSQPDARGNPFEL